MKKVSFSKIVIILSLTLMFSCEKTQIPSDNINPLIEEFIKSEDFNELYLKNSKFAQNGIVDINDSFVESILFNEETYNIITIVIKNNDNMVGQVFGFNLINGKRDLKTGHNYLMAYRDLREFDLITQSGIVSDYDLNFDNYLCGELFVVNNIISEANHFRMPEKISSKYGFERTYDIHDKSAHPCDRSGEGDISFGECYSCLKEAIESDVSTELMCDALDVGLLCSGSVVAACILISSIR